MHSRNIHASSVFWCILWKLEIPQKTGSFSQYICIISTLVHPEYIGVISENNTYTEHYYKSSQHFNISTTQLNPLKYFVRDYRGISISRRKWVGVPLKILPFICPDFTLSLGGINLCPEVNMG